MKEIVDGIYTWSWFSAPHQYNFNGFLVLHRDGNLCIDPAEMDEQTLNEIADLGVSCILLTNRNHVRAANRVKARCGAPIAIHRDDAAYARTQGAQLDDEIEPGQKIGPLRVIGLPGKSPGEVGFHWPERRMLIVGDAVVGDPPGRLKLLPERVVDDPLGLRKSVSALLKLDLDVLLLGDGEPILNAGNQRLKELVASFPAD
jgi:glyoxylase-like metal-dependent hydrolase (beta-lactamase superfamily II)